jgi:hypothetical protein
MMRIRTFAAAAALVGVVTLAAGTAGAAPVPPRSARPAATAAALRPEQVRAAMEEGQRLKSFVDTLAGQLDVDPQYISVQCEGPLFVITYNGTVLYANTSLTCTLDALFDWFFG